MIFTMNLFSCSELDTTCKSNKDFNKLAMIIDIEIDNLLANISNKLHN